MKLLDDINTKTQLNEGVAEEEEVEKDISNILLYSGYQPGSPEWKSAMARWKRRRTSDPRMYKKFLELN